MRPFTLDPNAVLSLHAESAVSLRDLFMVDHPLIIQTGIREAARLRRRGLNTLGGVAIQSYTDGNQA